MYDDEQRDWLAGRDYELAARMGAERNPAEIDAESVGEPADEPLDQLLDEPAHEPAHEPVDDGWVDNALADGDFRNGAR